MVPHATPGLTPRARLAARWLHYVAFTVLFGTVYGVLAATGQFPRWLLFGALLVSLSKDVYDEHRLRGGRPPLVYAGVEHAPSNAVLLVLLVAGVLDPVGSFLGATARTWAIILAAVDLVFDLSQDLRA